jgi:hypothetical protein
LEVVVVVRIILKERMALLSISAKELETEVEQRKNQIPLHWSWQEIASSA